MPKSNLVFTATLLLGILFGALSATSGAAKYLAHVVPEDYCTEARLTQFVTLMEDAAYRWRCVIINFQGGVGSWNRWINQIESVAFRPYQGPQ